MSGTIIQFPSKHCVDAEELENMSTLKEWLTYYLRQNGYAPTCPIENLSKTIVEVLYQQSWLNLKGES